MEKNVIFYALPRLYIFFIYILAECAYIIMMNFILIKADYKALFLIHILYFGFYCLVFFIIKKNIFLNWQI